jgi:Spy/CpxP family protein refolding chaperone
MEKMAIMTVLILSAMVLTSLTFASGWGRGHSRSSGSEGDITAIPELELTNEQVVQIKALREAHLKDIRPLQDNMHSQRKDLRLLWLQDTPDQEKINAAQAEIGSLRDQMQNKMADHRLAIFKILTPEQQSTLQSAERLRGVKSVPHWGKNR